MRIAWTKSGYDFVGSSSPIIEYAIYRRIDQFLASSSPALARALAEDEEAGVAYPPGDWDFVKTVPADCEDSYSTVVPTLADSTEDDGIVYTAFFVRARTGTPGVYYDAPVDSGYSVDNLAPSPPGGFVMTSPTALAWEESEAADFDYFTVYGSDVPGLDSTATLIGYTVGTSMDITGDVYEYYHVTAFDFSGNEGDPSSLENAYSGVDTPDDRPAAFALRQGRPNPFGAKTSIAFDLPEDCAVSLRVFDAQGRQVKTLVDRVYPAGRHTATWAGDDYASKPVGSGIYFVRMVAEDFKAVSKVLIAR